MTASIVKSAFVVVLFKKDNEVGVIPDLWLKSHEKCTWPDYKTTQRNEKAVVNRVVSEPDWPTYEIKVLSSTDSYVKAQDLIKKAEYTDHIDTEYDTDGRPKRYKRNESSSDDAYEPPVKKCIPVKKRNKTTELVFDQMDSNIVVDYSTASSTDDDTLEPSAIRRKTKTPRRSPRKIHTPSVSLPSTSPRKQHMSPISLPRTSPRKPSSSGTSSTPKVANITDGIVRALAEIKTDIGAIKREVAALRTVIVHRDQHDTTEKNMQCVLPVSNDEELKQLEMELQTKEKQKILKTKLTNIGGSDLKDAIRRMLVAVMTTSYMSGFNWTGKMTHISTGRKKGFHGLILSRILSASAMDCALSGGGPNSMKYVENAIKQFLRSNIDRINTFNKRVNNSKQTTRVDLI